MFFLNRKTGKELKNKIGQHNLHQLKHNNDPPCTESSQKIFLCFFKKFSELVCSLPNRTLDLDLWRQIWFQHERWHKKKAQESPVIPSQEKRRFSTVPCRWAAQTLVLNTAETDAMQRWKKKKKDFTYKNNLRLWGEECYDVSSAEVSWSQSAKHR